MARRHGSTGQMMMDPAGASTYVAVASIKSWSLDLSRERSDATAFGDTNRQYTQGLPDIKGNYSGWWDETTTPDSIFDVVLGSVPAGLKLLPSTITPTYFFSGLAYLDGSINVDNGGTIAISGSFVGAGNWTIAP